MSQCNRKHTAEKHHTTPPINKIPLPGRKDSPEPDGEWRTFCFTDLTRFPDGIYRNLAPWLARKAQKMGVGRDQCEDMAQEALLHAFAHSEQFRGSTSKDLCSWLAAILHNVVVDVLRGRVRHTSQSLDDMKAEPMDEKDSHRAQEVEWSECLVNWLERLRQEDPENCHLVCARYLEERTIGELADQTGRKAHAISCGIYRTLRKVRSWASESGINGENTF